MAKQRLDSLLVERQLCDSRQQAQRLIRAGSVRVNQQVIDKPGTTIRADAAIVVAQKPPYVSRGGLKLEKALKTFAVTVKGRICLDGGISTGGFTDCLLQAGASLVYGVDVGYGQVAWTLRQDERVILKERTNFRHLDGVDLYGDRPLADLGVMDVSFIALEKVLPALHRLLQPPREAILLIKPQFEVGRDRVGKKGVVRDPQAHIDAIAQVQQGACDRGWQALGLTYSPISGPAGNLEYLLWLQETGQTTPLPLPTITEVVQQAQLALKSPKTDGPKNNS